MKRGLTVVAALALCACASDPSGGHHRSHGLGSEPHHANMHGAAGAFHDLMEPLWHSPVGAARVSASCAKAGEIAARIAALAGERSQSAVPAAMAETARGLPPACAANKNDAVELAVDTLHQQFRQLMGMGGRQPR